MNGSPATSRSRLRNPQRRWVAAVGLAAAVVLAGCSGGEPSSDGMTQSDAEKILAAAENHKFSRISKEEMFAAIEATGVKVCVDFPPNDKTGAASFRIATSAEDCQALARGPSTPDSVTQLTMFAAESIMILKTRLLACNTSFAIGNWVLHGGDCSYPGVFGRHAAETQQRVLDGLRTNPNATIFIYKPKASS